VPEGNICINIYGGNRSSLWLSPDPRQSLSLGEKLSPHLRQSLSYGERSHNSCNITQRTSILFTWKTSQLERKNYRPEPSKSSSTIIKWGYNKFFSREH
jgi:hypothetical protein